MDYKPFIPLFLFLLCAGVAFYLLPMEGAIKATSVKVVIVIAVIWLLVLLVRVFGLMPR